MALSPGAFSKAVSAASPKTPKASVKNTGLKRASPAASSSSTPSTPKGKGTKVNSPSAPLRNVKVSKIMAMKVSPKTPTKSPKKSPTTSMKKLGSKNSPMKVMKKNPKSVVKKTIGKKPAMKKSHSHRKGRKGCKDSSDDESVSLAELHRNYDDFGTNWVSEHHQVELDNLVHQAHADWVDYFDDTTSYRIDGKRVKAEGFKSYMIGTLRGDGWKRIRSKCNTFCEHWKLGKRGRVDFHL
eukprot:symbB.v1.2.035727.t1/scaffold4873.1/size33619/2